MSSYSVQFDVDIKGLSEGERRQIDQTMQQIAEVVSTVPKASPFWVSMKHSVLQIDVAGWRLGYRIEQRTGLVRVIEVSRL